jgi:tRNA nucleotidyltransferase (CCA-adding enzyme)
VILGSFISSGSVCVGMLQSVIEEARVMADPSEEELANLRRASRELQEEVGSFVDVHELPVVDVKLCGSTSPARETFVSGDRDIDMFVRFETNVDESEMESYVTRIGEAVITDARKDFASHPYVKGTYEGFEVDLVPCYAVESPAEIQSAVDRTPFHTDFLEGRLDEELASDVRVAKKFLKGVGAYGSDVATNGFSGFLTELLVIEADGFVPLLELVADWDGSKMVFNPGDVETGQLESSPRNSSIVVIDPTDPSRNVGANLSTEKFSQLVLSAKEFLAEPDVSFFKPDENQNDDPFDAAFNCSFDARGTSLLTITFPIEESHTSDTIVPQLRKTEQSIVSFLEDEQFNVFQSRVRFESQEGRILVELVNSERPAVRRVSGPPVYRSEGVMRFKEAYEDDPNVVGPFLEDNRLMVDKYRDITDVETRLEEPDVEERISVGADLEWNRRNTDLLE